MNKLLPNLEDLFPITDERKTFSETPFNKDFEKLSFISKLQIVNDIIRQTMMYNPIPNSETEIEQLIGDSYTASKSAIEYLKHLNIGCNYRSVFARKKVYEPDDIGTMHVITLVDDPKTNNTYQFDSSPFVEYKCGKVEDITSNKFYEDYIEIKDELLEIYEKMRILAYKLISEDKSEDVIKEFEHILNDAKTYKILNNYISYYYLMLAEKTNDKNESLNYLNLAKLYNPYLNINDINNNKIEYKNYLALEHVKILNEELSDLIFTNINYSRQIELAQNITRILNNVYDIKEKYLFIDNQKINFSCLSPRFFLEKGLNVVLIKSSSYKLGVQSTIREKFLKRGNGAIGEYKTNLGIPTDLGVRPMLMFHPHGYKYERSMSGPIDLFLVQAKADEILKKKRELRNSLGQKINNHEVLWYDGKPIIWDPIITNLVHTTDDPSEACMHYLCAYPEYQLMTRFMYPNPILAKEEKNGRIRI